MSAVSPETGVLRRRFRILLLVRCFVQLSVDVSCPLLKLVRRVLISFVEAAAVLTRGKQDQDGDDHSSAHQ